MKIQINSLFAGEYIRGAISMEQSDGPYRDFQGVPIIENRRIVGCASARALDLEIRHVSISEMLKRCMRSFDSGEPITLSLVIADGKILEALII